MYNSLMKTHIVTWLLFMTSWVSNAQDQFTNTGTLQVFAGTSVTFFGNFENNGAFTDAGDLTFKGSSAQIISGTSITTFNHCVLDNASGLTLQQDAIISGQLELTQGRLDLATRTLSVTNNLGSAITRTSGYILSENTTNASKLRWSINTNTDAHVFPFGTTTAEYIPLTLQLTSGNIGNCIISTYPTATNNTPYPTSVTNVDRFGADNSANVVDRFWQIDKDGASGTANITFIASSAEVGSMSFLRAQRWNTATSIWEAPLASQTETPTGVTVFNVTAFSPWTLSGNDRSLPVELLSFSATPMMRDVQVKWKTASEKNNAYFTLQRSADGMIFSDLAKIAGALSSSEIRRYDYLDLEALPGRSYYRLLQTDLDGKSKFSNIIVVYLEESEPSISVYPNPASNGSVSVNFHPALEQQTKIILYDSNGRIVASGMILEGSSVYVLDLTRISSGIYHVKATNSANSFKQTIIIE